MTEPFNPWAYTQEYSVLGRWTRRRDTGASLEVQSSVGFRHNEDGPSPSQTNFDVDAQYHTAVGSRHDLVVGAGYRLVDERVPGSFTFSITPSEVVNHVFKVFAQDEIALGRRVRLTLGTKVERDSYAGWAVQPTARVMWRFVPQQHVWAAVSRAVRTPSLGEVSARNNFTSFIGQGGLPVVVGAIGNPDFQSEEVLTTEAGYRREIGSVLSVDVTAFVSRYDNLKTSEPLPPRLEQLPAPTHLFIPVQFGNLLEATASGVEVAVHWAPARWCAPRWRLLDLSPDAAPLGGEPRRERRVVRRQRAWRAVAGAVGLLPRPRCRARRHAVPHRRPAQPRRRRLHARGRASAGPRGTRAVPLDRRTEPVRSRARGVRGSRRDRDHDAHPAKRVDQSRLEAAAVRKRVAARVTSYCWSCSASWPCRRRASRRARAPDLNQMSIEDLMNIEITSASRKEERAADVAAAVFVITRDDIRRSGMTTIPDLLRLAPGVQVAQINANKWAVSVRGFNGLFANKLLVLVDGRSVYNRLFSGVIWHGEDMMLDDVDRIEVIRGPGAAMWGANAVNGVINIVTEATAETQGGLVRVEAGGSGTQGVARYGGTVGAARYRLFAQWTGRDESLIAPGIAGRRCVTQRDDGIPRRLDHDAGRVLRSSGAFTASRERSLWINLDPQTAAGEPIATTASESAVRPSPRPLDADARERRVAADPVVCRHRRPARADRELSPQFLRRRDAIPHGARRAPRSGRRRRLPVHRRDAWEDTSAYR